MLTREVRVAKVQKGLLQIVSSILEELDDPPPTEEDKRKVRQVCAAVAPGLVQIWDGLDG